MKKFLAILAVVSALCGFCVGVQANETDSSCAGASGANDDKVVADPVPSSSETIAPSGSQAFEKPSEKPSKKPKKKK